MTNDSYIQYDADADSDADADADAVAAAAAADDDLVCVTRVLHVFSLFLFWVKFRSISKSEIETKVQSIGFLWHWFHISGHQPEVCFTALILFSQSSVRLQCFWLTFHYYNTSV